MKMEKIKRSIELTLELTGSEVNIARAALEHYLEYSFYSLTEFSRKMDEEELKHLNVIQGIIYKINQMKQS